MIRALLFLLTATVTVAAEPVLTAVPIAWTLPTGPAIVEGYRIYAVTTPPVLRPDGLGSTPASIVAPKLVGEVKIPSQAAATVTFPQEPGKRYWLVLTSYGPSGESNDPTSLRRQYSEPLEVTYGIDLGPEAPGNPRRTGPVRLVPSSQP